VGISNRGDLCQQDIILKEKTSCIEIKLRRREAQGRYTTRLAGGMNI